MKPRLFLWLVAAILIAGLVASPVFAQATGTPGAPAKAAQKAETKAAPAAPAAGAAAKPAAKAAKAEIQAQTPPKPGMVWVNTASKKYFKEGSQFYGKTKEGKFMTEEEAKKAGYTAAATGGAKPAAKPAAKKTP
jgi:hypothetical protein